MHGKELPKYNDTHKEYWTLKPSYTPHPPNQSHTLFTSSQKFWAKPDIIKLSDISNDPPRIDRTFVAVPKTDDIIAIKVTNSCPFENFNPDKEIDPSKNTKPKHNYRMSTVVNYFVKSANDLGFNIPPVDTKITEKSDEKEKGRKSDIKVERAQSNPFSSQSSKLVRSGSAPILKKTFTSPNSAVRSKGFIF